MARRDMPLDEDNCPVNRQTELWVESVTYERFVHEAAGEADLF